MCVVFWSIYWSNSIPGEASWSPTSINSNQRYENIYWGRIQLSDNHVTDTFFCRHSVWLTSTLGEQFIYPTQSWSQKNSNFSKMRVRMMSSNVLSLAHCLWFISLLRAISCESLCLSLTVCCRLQKATFRFIICSSCANFIYPSVRWILQSPPSLSAYSLC